MLLQFTDVVIIWLNSLYNTVMRWLLHKFYRYALLSVMWYNELNCDYAMQI